MTKELLDFQTQWEILVDKAFKDYRSLSIPERVWFSVQSIIQAVDNGGILSFYYNSYGDHLFETMEDLRLIGATDIFKILERVNALFPSGRPSHDSEKRNEIIETWSDDLIEELFHKLDDEFYKREDALERRLVNYIIENKLVP